jgi:hypothetical protein
MTCGRPIRLRILAGQTRAFARRLGRASALLYMAGPSEKVPQGALAVVVAEDREESEQAKQEVRDSS